MPIFAILQSLDLLTTLVFLHNGVAEGNPLLIWGLGHARSPWIGLVAAKLLAMLIGLYCYRTGRMTALRLANVGYFVIVGLNLVTIAAGFFAVREDRLPSRPQV